MESKQNGGNQAEHGAAQSLQHMTSTGKHAKEEVAELPYLENELWHKIFTLTDLESCKADRIVYYEKLCKDVDAAWDYLMFEKWPRKQLEWATIITLLRLGKIPTSREKQVRVCEALATWRNPLMLREARRAGCDWEASVMLFAVANDSLPCCEWLHKNGCPWHSSCISMATDSGYCEVLKYLEENGCPPDLDLDRSPEEILELLQQLP